MASRKAFANACIQLYARLWAQLDELPGGQGGVLKPTQAAAADGYEILRLEIHLLSSACDTPRWRMLLNTPQRVALKSVLRDLLVFDAGSEGDSGRWVAAAQNYLFDAIRDMGAAAGSDPDWKLRIAIDGPMALEG